MQQSRALLQPLLAAAAANPQLASRNLLAKTALVVDANEATRTTLETMIKNEEGWVVISAKNGQEALARLQHGLRPDIIIADLLMPEMDGVAFVSRVREDPHLRTLKIIITSAAQDRGKLVALAALGVRTYLGKPFEQAKVTSLLRTGAIAPAEEESA